MKTVIADRVTSKKSGPLENTDLGNKLKIYFKYI